MRIRWKEENYSSRKPIMVRRHKDIDIPYVSGNSASDDEGKIFSELGIPPCLGIDEPMSTKSIVEVD